MSGEWEDKIPRTWHDKHKVEFLLVDLNKKPPRVVTEAARCLG